MITEEMMAEIVAGAKVRLQDEMVKSVQQSVQWKVQNAVGAEIQGIVEKFCRETVVPEVQEQLAGQKSILVDAVAKACQEAAEGLAKAITARVAKNLGDSYRQDEVFKALFK